MVSYLKHPISLTGIGALCVYGGYEFLRVIQAGHKYEIDEQDNKTYIVTGANSGIGKALAKELAMRNAQVIMACRDRNKCLEVRRDIVLKSRNKKVFCRICDLSDFESVHNFVQKITNGKYEFKQIDGVILNAATKSKKYVINKEGIENSLATNHMGSFLLVGLLLQKLLEQEGPSKIVFVGTDIATRDCLELDLNAINDAKYTHKMLSSTEKLDSEKGKYDMHSAYKFSKMMQLLFSRELAERLNDSKISVVVADPGGTKSNLNKDETAQNFFLTRWAVNSFGYLTGNRKKPEHSIFPILYALVDEKAVNGKFVGSRCKERAWGENMENRRLRTIVWSMSEKWTRLTEHMNRMETEMKTPNYFARDLAHQTEDVEPKKSRSAKYLWMA